MDTPSMTNNGQSYIRTAITRKLTLAVAIGLLTGSMVVSGADQAGSFCQSAGAKNNFDCAKTPEFQADQADIDSRLNALNNWLEDEEQALSSPLVTTEKPDSDKLREKIKFNSQLLASELKQAKKLQQNGDLKGAFNKVNSYLANNPKDPNGWLLYGISLINQNKLDEAADVFTRLIQLYPEAPEPYNNLAVVHARKGENDAAVEVLLQAFETHPSYAQVQRNLKAVYASLATQAYNRALNIGSTTQAPRAHLGILDQVYNPVATPTLIASTAQIAAVIPPAAITESAVKPSLAKQQSTEPVIEERKVSEGTVPAISTEQPEPQLTVAQATPVTKSSQTETSPVTTVAPTKPEMIVSTDATESDKAKTTSTVETSNEALISDQLRSELHQLISNWASAWSSQDVESYLGFYTQAYSPDPKVNHTQWERYRNKRITKPNFIKVDISDISFAKASNGKVRSVFRQTYQSDTYQDKVYKTLILVRENGQWKITTETTL